MSASYSGSTAHSCRSQRCSSFVGALPFAAICCGAVDLEVFDAQHLSAQDLPLEARLS